MIENVESEDIEQNSDGRTIVQNLKTLTKPRCGKRSQKIQLTAKKVQPVYLMI